MLLYTTCNVQYSFSLYIVGELIVNQLIGFIIEFLQSFTIKFIKLIKLNLFTFMHLADAFIQSDLHCIQVTVSTFYQLLLSLGIEPMILALLTPCSTSWATGKL